MPANIGIFCPGDGTSGPWRYVHSLVAGMDPGEFRVTIFCDLPGEYAPRRSVRVVRLGEPMPMGRGLVPVASFPIEQPYATNDARSKARCCGLQALRLWAGFARTARRLARLVGQSRLDLFHTQNTGCEESPLAAKIAQVPRIVGTFHVDSSYDLHGRRSGARYRVLEHISNYCLTRAIGVSRRTSEDWIRRTHLPAHRVVTIHNGIDPAKFQRRDDRVVARVKLGLPGDDRLIIGGVGRLDEAKGFEYLLDAMALLREEFPRAMLVLAGRGGLRDALDAKAQRLGIADRVRFLGFSSDVQTLLDSLDIFAMPSLCEALPYALLEAMSTGLPAVGTTVGGIPEVILDGQTGLLVPPRDARAFANAMLMLLRDSALRDRMGIAARDRVATQFNEIDSVRRTIQLYRDLLAGR